MVRSRGQDKTKEERELASREVVQSYIVTTAMYDFNVYEKRVLYNLVKLAQSQLEGIKLADNLYKIDHHYQDFLKIELPVADFLLDSDDKNHSRIKDALKTLHQKTFTYLDEDVWECFSIIANPKIELRSSKVSFIVNSKVWDVLLNFTKGFSRYSIDVAFSLESPYAMRFYEMMAGITDFGDKYNFADATVENIVHVIEESTLMLGADNGLKVKVSYSEKNSDIEVVVATGVALPADLLEKDDNVVSAAILRGMSKEFKYESGEGGSRISVKM